MLRRTIALAGAAGLLLCLGAPAQATDCSADSSRKSRTGAMTIGYQDTGGGCCACHNEDTSGQCVRIVQYGQEGSPTELVSHAEWVPAKGAFAVCSDRNTIGVGKRFSCYCEAGERVHVSAYTQDFQGNPNNTLSPTE